ncbi:SigE family RNA polymerase sigma factor [Streptomyces alkaliterrae]|uniref:SigE family RNA polymerase sigma factor n=1 Tax=Streptomyces alkaliterrae TaxID=2213162 RepID=A0A5P0YSS4_9ACTN|nr:SigE family RNA polymerase sigma factor [Streptomyces alkaliterrae]MBB1254645.1 SigE family RNA polymerase sigma factor [Streptomyces alkaliterrae]MBB1259523.1 SigE family RNA polymerase sigma factor [Streptomyces alkaliterrae]MQS02950.1 SigE family RNA polymerase sigma factor [Streptomyces alkaliterrae]
MKKSAEDDFRMFVRTRWPRLLRTAYLLTGHHQDAEDLVQAVLARAYTRWERVSGARDPDAYVWRVMINMNADRLRRRRLGEWLTGWLPERAAPDSADEQVLERGVLLDALRALPPRQRATVVLRYLEDRSEREVAELLGTGVGTVRSQTARALRRLRAELPELTTSERV